MGWKFCGDFLGVKDFSEDFVRVGRNLFFCRKEKGYFGAYILGRWTFLGSGFSSLGFIGVSQ